MRTRVIYEVTCARCLDTFRSRYLLIRDIKFIFHKLNCKGIYGD